ncbi:ABC transporter permease subunit [Ectobacillus ponti]|uniref:ABC transporter permease subunit n=1 Tax=Ectobacillus ponti TaxID=2961894 RepID=A0AA41X9S5_9BACI|nr:ABC transporter permease subunit [Ectobacillus ponti]MCP8968918.1 ABC transporter permease subunit [Ectobacillus ponti]
MLQRLFRIIAGVLGVLTALLILLSLPALFSKQGSISFQPAVFWDKLLALAKQLLHPEKLEYASSMQRIGELPRMFPLFPNVWEPYMYSFALLAAAFVSALLLASCLAYVYVLISKRWKGTIQAVMFVLESTPDMMILICSQMFFIWLLRQTGWMPFHILAFGDKKAYALPIICLTILPTVQLFRMFVLCLAEESSKPYVETARGKGMSSAYIVRMHLFRNVWIHLLHHAKTISLFLISNLLVLEIVFNIPGIMRFLVRTYAGAPAVTFAVLLLIFAPFFLFFLGSSCIAKRFSGESGAAKP